MYFNAPPISVSLPFHQGRQIAHLPLPPIFSFSISPDIGGCIFQIGKGGEGGGRGGGSGRWNGMGSPGEKGEKTGFGRCCKIFVPPPHSPRSLVSMGPGFICREAGTAGKGEEEKEEEEAGFQSSFPLPVHFTLCCPLCAVCEMPAGKKGEKGKGGRGRHLWVGKEIWRKRQGEWAERVKKSGGGGTEIAKPLRSVR